MAFMTERISRDVERGLVGDKELADLRIVRRTIVAEDVSFSQQSAGVNKFARTRLM
jgi:hypothetical protein